MRYFTSHDVPPDALVGERIAVLGYGNLGRTIARNLRDSGIDSLTVGNIEDASADLARQDGFQVVPIAVAVAAADVILVMLPDDVLPEVFCAHVAPHLSANAAIVLGSGYPLTLDWMRVPEHVDVLLLAPRMSGEPARQSFVSQEGFYAFVSVEQDKSGRAWPRLLGLADAVGVMKKGAFELDARREACLDLLNEQTMGAILGFTIMQVFALGVEAGLPPEALVLDLYMSGEMESVFQSFRTKGFFQSATEHGAAAMLGASLRMTELMSSDLAERFQGVLDNIRTGKFAAQFRAERDAGYPSLAFAKVMINGDNPQAAAEARVRAMINNHQPQNSRNGHG